MQLSEKPLSNQINGIDIFQYKALLPSNRTHVRSWKKNQIRMSDPKKFNDMFDLNIKIIDQTKYGPYRDLHALRNLIKVMFGDNPTIWAWFFSPSLFKDIQAWAYDALPGDMEALITSIKTCVSDFGVSCFTHDGTHPLMWSHYANRHTGYIVKYKLNQIELAQNQTPITLSSNVEYTAKLPTLCISEALLTPHQALERLLCTKSTHWAYENEIRLISPNYKDKILEIPQGLTMQAIIAGERMNDKDLTLLARKAKQFGVPMFQAKANNSYEITIDNKYPNK